MWLHLGSARLRPGQWRCPKSSVSSCYASSFHRSPRSEVVRALAKRSAELDLCELRRAPLFVLTEREEVEGEAAGAAKTKGRAWRVLTSDFGRWGVRVHWKILEVRRMSVPASTDLRKGSSLSRVPFFKPSTTTSSVLRETFAATPPEPNRMGLTCFPKRRSQGPCGDGHIFSSVPKTAPPGLLKVLDPSYACPADKDGACSLKHPTEVEEPELGYPIGTLVGCFFEIIKPLFNDPFGNTFVLRVGLRATLQELLKLMGCGVKATPRRMVLQSETLAEPAGGKRTLWGIGLGV